MCSVLFLLMLSAIVRISYALSISCHQKSEPYEKGHRDVFARILGRGAGALAGTRSCWGQRYRRARRQPPRVCAAWGGVCRVPCGISACALRRCSIAYTSGSHVVTRATPRRQQRSPLYQQHARDTAPLSSPKRRSILWLSL